MTRQEFYQQLEVANFRDRNLKQEIGDLISFWGTDRGDEIVDKNLIKACQYWVNLRRSEIDGFRSKVHHKVFYQFLKEAIVEGEPLNYFGILCPSYKKGKGEIGFKDKPGNTTYRAFANLHRMWRNTIGKMEIPCTEEMFFADISLERFEELQPEDLRDLGNIIEEDAKIAAKYEMGFSRLSEIGGLGQIVGRAGKLVLEDKIPVDPKAIERARWRDRQFYAEQFGWTKEMSDRRTQILAHSYACQAEAMVQYCKRPVMVYSAHDCEKGTLYNGLDGKNRFVVIYPKKDFNNPIASTIPIWQ